MNSAWLQHDSLVLRDGSSSRPYHTSRMESQTSSCFNCRYPLDGIESRQCPECGRPFDPDDAGTFNRILSDPVELTRLHIAEATGLRLRLEHAGIAVSMQQQTGGIIMYAPVPMAALFVNKSDYDAARQIMDEQALDAAHPTPAAGHWTCPQCGEQIEAQFDLCWNCGAERPGD